MQSYCPPSSYFLRDAPIPIYNGVDVLQRADACANLPLDPLAYFFMGNMSLSPAKASNASSSSSTLLAGVTSCLAVDPCTSTFALGFAGMDIPMLAWPEPPITVTAGLDVLAISLNGALLVVSKTALWDLSTLPSLGGTGALVYVSPTCDPA